MWPILGSARRPCRNPGQLRAGRRVEPSRSRSGRAPVRRRRRAPAPEVLADLGGFAVERLVDPDADTIWTALDRAEDALVAAGGPSVFVLPSGHARARALDLGDETVDLDALEARLASLPATVVVALFDACQAGVGGAAKGVVPDASFSTVAVLDTAGMVVLASSTATELSQESPELGGSYFTNAVVTGLRGAADSDGDGRVSLFEVYGYAYHQTLRDTSATAIGGQHPTLASDLRGHGDLILTRTERADSHLVFAAGEDTQFLVAGEAGTVAVEGVRSPADPLNLALAAGRYELVLRRAGAISRCRVVLAPGGVHPLGDADCAAARTSGAPKGGTNAERLMLELGVGSMPNTDWRLTDQLRALGWIPLFRTGIVDPVVSGSVGRSGCVRGWRWSGRWEPGHRSVPELEPEPAPDVRQSGVRRAPRGGRRAGHRPPGPGGFPVRAAPGRRRLRTGPGPGAAPRPTSGRVRAGRSGCS